MMRVSRIGRDSSVDYLSTILGLVAQYSLSDRALRRLVRGRVAQQGEAWDSRRYGWALEALTYEGRIVEVQGWRGARWARGP